MRDISLLMARFSNIDMLEERIHTIFSKIENAKRARLWKLSLEVFPKETKTAKAVEDTMSNVLCILNIHSFLISRDFLKSV